MTYDAQESEQMHTLHAMGINSIFVQNVVIS